jgi:hypothetical protein
VAVDHSGCLLLVFAQVGFSEAYGGLWVPSDEVVLTDTSEVREGSRDFFPRDGPITRDDGGVCPDKRDTAPRGVGGTMAVSASAAYNPFAGLEQTTFFTHSLGI